MTSDRDSRAKQRLARLLDGVPERERRKLRALDPTGQDEFAGYLGRLYRQTAVDERPRLLGEDAGKAYAYLWAAKQLQSWELSVRLNEGGGTDKRAKPLPELYGDLRPHLTRLVDLELPDTVSLWLGDEIRAVGQVVEPRGRTSNAEERALLDSEGLEIVFDRGPLKLYLINDHAGAKYAGRGTKWCTTQTDPKYFKAYRKNGKLLALVVRGMAEKYQFFFRRWQMTDARDSPVDFDEVLQALPAGNTVKTAFKGVLGQLVVDEAVCYGSLPSRVPLSLFNCEQLEPLLRLTERFIVSPREGVREMAATCLPHVILHGDAMQKQRGLAVCRRFAADEAIELQKHACHLVANVISGLDEGNQLALLMTLQPLTHDARDWVKDSLSASMLVALPALRPAAREQALGYLASLVADPSESTRRFSGMNMIKALPKVAGAEQEALLDLLAGLVADGNKSVRRTIAETYLHALSSLGGPQCETAWRSLRALADDSELTVRRAFIAHCPDHFKERLKNDPVTDLKRPATAGTIANPLTPKP